jgi:hypothetical protein
MRKRATRRRHDRAPEPRGGVPLRGAGRASAACLTRVPVPEAAARPDRGRGWHAVVEELLDRGVRACAHDAPIRGALARALARMVELCRGFRALPGLRPSLLASPAGGELWPEPHDRRFDFARTAAGAAWIDALAARAHMRLAASSGEIVVAHSDWRAEHVRFEGEEIVAAYDWQSLAVGREPALVGAAAHAFSAAGAYPKLAGSPRSMSPEPSLPTTRRRAARPSRRQSAKPSTPPGYTRPPTALAASTPTHNADSRGRKRRSATTATAACSRATATSCSHESTPQAGPIDREPLLAAAMREEQWHPQDRGESPREGPRRRLPRGAAGRVPGRCRLGGQPMSAHAKRQAGQVLGLRAPSPPGPALEHNRAGSASLSARRCP